MKRINVSSTKIQNSIMCGDLRLKKEQDDFVEMKPNPVDIGEGTWNTSMFMERRYLALHKII